ncbi:MAG: SMC-Scp complex subunit ScpB [Nocardioidaceae bacterium]
MSDEGTQAAQPDQAEQPEQAEQPDQSEAPEQPLTADEPEGDAVSSLPLQPALEAVLMIADAPLDHVTLAQAVGRPPQEVAEALHRLAHDYTEQGRGFDLREIGGGWRFYTRDDYAPVVEKFVVDGQQARLTQAALETLAVVAYRQPVSRGRVSAIRGVNVDGVMRTLVTRGLVEEAGSDDETGAVLYRTTSYFLERMGLSSLDGLPDLAPLLPEMSEVEDDLDGRETPAPTTHQDEPASP